MKSLIFLIIILIFGVCDTQTAEYKPVGRNPAAIAPARPKAPTATSKATAGTRQTAAPRKYVGKDGTPLLFGTVEFGNPMKSIPKWTDVVARNEQDPIFQLERYFNRTTTWGNLRDKASGKTPMQQLQLINEFWNKWKYIDDRTNWNMIDYWASPAQFLKKSGDCEDYAIAKYFTLKELGFDPHTLRIVVLKNTFTNEDHAVLAVYLNDDVFILDNLSPIVLSHKRISQYAPQVSLNEFRSWRHIPPKIR